MLRTHLKINRYCARLQNCMARDAVNFEMGSSWLQALVFVVTIAVPILQTACSHKPAVLTLNELRNKRVALVQIDAPQASRNQIEITLVNVIIEKGYFEIIDRATVQNALVENSAESDWLNFGKKLNADYVLSFRIDQFNIKERKGLDRIEIDDSLLTEEYGSSKTLKNTRYSKVKSYDGILQLTGKFLSVAENKIVYTGIGLAQDRIILPEGSTPKGKLKFLEELSERAVRDFFKKMKVNL